MGFRWPGAHGGGAGAFPGALETRALTCGQGCERGEEGGETRAGAGPEVGPGSPGQAENAGSPPAEAQTSGRKPQEPCEVWDLLETTWSVVRIGPEERRKGLQGKLWPKKDSVRSLGFPPGTSVTLACGWVLQMFR